MKKLLYNIVLVFIAHILIDIIVKDVSSTTKLLLLVLIMSYNIIGLMEGKLIYKL